MQPDLVREIQQEVERARKAYDAASVHFDAILRDAPSGIASRDRLLRVRRANEDFKQALRTHAQAMVRLTEYLTKHAVPVPPKPVTVLLADDHAMVIEGLRRVLEPEFTVVGGVTDGLALVKAAEKLQSDVIVVDVSMPLLNGIEAVRQILANHPSTKVVFLSMHPDIVYVSEAFKAGGSAYVLKSSAGIEILTAIREALQGRTFLTPTIDKGSLEAQLKRNQSPPDAVLTLSPRRRQVLQMVAEGRTTKQIAEALRISPRTVEFHRYRAMESLGLHTIAELVQYAIKNCIITT